MGGGEEKCASCSDREQCGFRSARTKAIEEQPKRQLEGCKWQKIGAGQKAKTGRIQIQINGQIGADNGITDPEGIREKITQCKRDKNPDYP
jgi:hypothetical protein